MKVIKKFKLLDFNDDKELGESVVRFLDSYPDISQVEITFTFDKKGNDTTRKVLSFEAREANITLPRRGTTFFINNSSPLLNQEETYQSELRRQEINRIATVTIEPNFNLPEIRGHRADSIVIDDAMIANSEM